MVVEKHGSVLFMFGRLQEVWTILYEIKLETLLNQPHGGS